MVKPFFGYTVGFLPFLGEKKTQIVHEKQQSVKLCHILHD